jgi:hypothetical protein
MELSAKTEERSCAVSCTISPSETMNYKLVAVESLTIVQ